jgi:hypothetical protein
MSEMSVWGGGVWGGAWRNRLSGRSAPVWTAFLVSLPLSLLALHKGTINRDGMLYVETARVFLDQGLAASMAIYSWPFLSILMALVSQTTGLDLEASGYLLNALFMAGASALLVSCAARLYPESVWYVCLAVLALPGFNGYRDELLREYGAWFFSMLALWLALRWSDMPRWWLAFAIQLSLAVAALFRPEAIALLAALILWQIFEAPAGDRWRRLLMIGGPPLIGLTVLFILKVDGQLASTRLASDFGRFSVERFDAKALAIAPAFIDYARDQAHTILFYGSLAIVPVKFIGKMGLFIVPMLYAFASRNALALFAGGRIFFWAFLIHLLVLAAFALDMQFVSGRYIAPLVLFAAPVTGYGLWLLVKRFPRWKLAMVLLAMAIMIGNVVSFSPGKYHFVEAGAWLARNAEDTPRVYIESARAAYYAGWRFNSRPLPAHRPALAETLSRKQYDLYVLEIARIGPDTGKWMESEGLGEVIRFVNADQEGVIIARPLMREVQGAKEAIGSQP